MIIGQFQLLGISLVLVASVATCATPNKYTPTDAGADEGVPPADMAPPGPRPADGSLVDGPSTPLDAPPSPPDLPGPDQSPGGTRDTEAAEATPPPSDGMCRDCSAPTILTISPASGATGIRADAKIVITFSEPMERTTTQMAFASSDIPSRTFAWDSSGSILTITPTGGLQYASGSSLSVMARSYAYSIATSAADLAGNRLQQAALATFTTLRRISGSTPGATPELSGTVAGGQVPAFNDGYAWVSCNNNERAFLTFNIATLPNGIESFEAATANWAYAASLSVPTAQVEIAHLAFSAPSTPLFDAPAMVLGVLSAPQGRSTSFNGSQLRDAVWTDYQARSGSDRRTQFRMRLLNCSGMDGGSFSLDESTISMTYLIK